MPFADKKKAIILSHCKVLVQLILFKYVGACFADTCMITYFEGSILKKNAITVMQ